MKDNSIQHLIKKYWENHNPTLSEAMEDTALLESDYCKKKVKLGISASITSNPFDSFLRWGAACNGVSLDIVVGGYDDPINDIKIFEKLNVSDLVVIPHINSIIPAFETRINQISNEVLENIQENLINKYKLLFKEYSKFNSVNFFSYHAICIDADNNAEERKKTFIDNLNRKIKALAENYSSVRLIDSNKVINEIGFNESFNYRNYYQNKAPYSNRALIEFTKNIIDVTRAFGTYFYKALVLDCDNTLWGGVIGEDLINGIKLSQYDYPGNIFWHVQNEISNLEKNGVLICLCSKNNLNDVEHVIKNHESFVIKDSQIILKKVNWNNKVQNIKEISSDLNIGLDSIVFVDDSDFECESVRSQLPTVKVIQVPNKLSEYPNLLNKIKKLFLAGGVTKDSENKTGQYLIKSQADSLRSQFDNQEDYLKSLEIKVFISRDKINAAQRVSELSQKSNQFNLTTKRYSQSEIENLMKQNEFIVYSFRVVDRFGDSGITGVVIIHKLQEAAYVDSFFMSCRVLGRGIENSIWEKIIDDALVNGYGLILSEYIPTNKNSQVSNFYDNLGFIRLLGDPGGHTKYSFDISKNKILKSKWIEIICE